MGILKQGILGGFSGSVANVTGSSWKGIAIIKSKPISVANPRTAGQIAQRTRLSNIVAFAQLILAVAIKPLWDRFQTAKSGYNAFVSSNIDLFSTELPSVPADLVFSRGKMEATSITAVLTSAGSSGVDLEWANDSGQGFKLASDQVYALVINRTSGTIKAFGAAETRDAATVGLTFSENLQSGDVLDVYLSFLRADGTIVSNSAYATHTVA